MILTVSLGSSIIGFSLTGNSIPAGDGLLTSLSGSFNDFEACIDDLILSVEGEGFHTYSSGDCVQTDAVADCNGIINGDATLDECGNCIGSYMDSGATSTENNDSNGSFKLELNVEGSEDSVIIEGGK